MNIIKIKNYILPIVFAIIQFLLGTFCFDKYFFNQPQDVPFYVSMKVLDFIVLVIAWLFIFYVIKEYKNNNSSIKRGVKYFSIILLGTTVLLLLLYPGLWSWDDIDYLLYSSNYIVYAWYHILSSAFFCLFAQILPFPAGIILIQNILISICAAFVLVKLENVYNFHLKNRFFDILIKLLPFFTFPVLRYQLSGYLIGLYSYLELALFVMVLCAIKKQEKWNLSYLFLFSTLVAITSSIQIQNHFFITIAILFMFLNKELTKNLYKILATIFILISFIGINLIQNHYDNNKLTKLYPTISPVSAVVKVADKTSDKEYLENINKVISVDTVIKNDDVDNLFWQNKIVKLQYSKAEYNNYLGSMFKLITKYPLAFLKAKYSLFHKASGREGEANVPVICKNSDVFNLSKDIEKNESFVNSSFILNKPISNNTRISTINTILLENQPIYKKVWNLFIPIYILVISACIFLYKKRWIELSYVSILGLQFLFTLLSAPSKFFIHYVPIYLQSYLILTIFLIFLLKRYEDKVQQLLIPLKEKYSAPTIIATSQFAISNIFNFNRFFFKTDIFYSNMIFLKILNYIFLVAFWIFVFLVYKKIKENDKLFKRGLTIFLSYFSLIFIVMLLVWPGTWCYDDILVLDSARRYIIFGWQHSLSSIWQIILAETIPFVGGIIFLQNLFISIMVSFTIVKIETTFNLYLKNKFFDILVKLLPFLMFPILRYQFSGYRMGIYTFIEMAFLAMAFCAVKEKEKWSKEYLSLFVFLTILVSTWRSEGIFYLILALIVIFIFKKFEPIYTKKIASCLLIVGVILLNILQKDCLGEEMAKDYVFVSTIRQCIYLVRHSDKIKDAKEIETIGKLVNLKIVSQHPDLKGDELWYNFAYTDDETVRTNSFVKTNYSKKTLNKYLNAYLSLVIKHQDKYQKERWDTFYEAAGMLYLKNRPKNLILHMAYLYDQTTICAKKFTCLAKYNNAISKNVRANTILALCCYGPKLKWLNYFEWNLLIPLSILIVFLIYLLASKKMKYMTVMSFALLKTLIVYFTSPCALLMYYLPIYLLGYIVLVFAILALKNKKYIKEKEV